MVNNLRVRVMVTRVRLPKCCKVSKMKSWPSAPVRANCARGRMMEGWEWMKESAEMISEPPLEG